MECLGHCAWFLWGVRLQSGSNLLSALLQESSVHNFVSWMVACDRVDFHDRLAILETTVIAAHRTLSALLIHDVNDCNGFQIAHRSP